MSHPPPGLLDMYKTDVVVTSSNKLGLMLGGHNKTSTNWLSVNTVKQAIDIYCKYTVGINKHHHSVLLHRFSPGELWTPPLW